jgi:hypothetical protein
MNLFILDSNPYTAAESYQDLHVNKIICEGSQMLANCYTLERLAQPDVPLTQKGTARVHSYQKHPMALWIRANIRNFAWTLQHLTALCSEYTYRFKKEHFNDKHYTEAFIRWCNETSPTEVLIKEYDKCSLTEWPQCFGQYPQCIVPGDPVAGYRNYYNTAKSVFIVRGKPVYATWTRRPVPAWFNLINSNHGSV